MTETSGKKQLSKTAQRRKAQTPEQRAARREYRKNRVPGKPPVRTEATSAMPMVRAKWPVKAPCNLCQKMIVQRQWIVMVEEGRWAHVHCAENEAATARLMNDPDRERPF